MEKNHNSVLVRNMVHDPLAEVIYADRIEKMIAEGRTDEEKLEECRK